LVTEIVADDKRDPHDRAVAAASVGYFGKDAIGACKTLLATVQYRKNDEDLRNEAIHSLARIGLHDPVASLAILKLLENEAEPPRIRGAAANAFEIDKVAGQRMLPDLLKFLLKKKKDEEREVNRRVLVTIAELRPGKGAAAALAEFVDDDKRTAALALRALARIGPEAKSALPIVMVAIVGQRPISGAIRDGIVEDPDEWEPILRNVFGRDNAIEMIRHSMLRDDPDEEALKSMILRLSKR
jgi:HEAT repeat protein